MKRRELLLAGSGLMGGVLTSGVARADVPVIKFGQSASLTGGQAAYGKDVRDGIAAAFAAASRKGPKFELLTLDDGGDKERCKLNTKALLQAGVVGLVGYTSGAAAESVASLIEESQTVMLGAASGNMGIRNEKLHMQYHVRAGYDLEYKRMVKYVKDFGMRRVGYVYLKDTSAANAAAMTAALETVGVKLTETIALDRNTASFEAESKKLLAAKLDCVLFTANASPVVGIVDQMAAGGYTGMYFSSSFAGQALIEAMAQKQQSVVMAQVVPRPNALGLQVVNRCHKDMAALGGGARVGFTSLEGYITGSVAVEAAKAGLKGGGLSRARFRESLAELRTDLGGYAIDFSGGVTQGSRFVDVVAIDRRGRVIG